MQRPRGMIIGAMLAPIALFTAFSAGYVMAEPEKPSAASLSAAHELIVATGASKQFEAVVPMMVQQLEPILLQMAPGKEAEIKEISLLNHRILLQQGHHYEEKKKRGRNRP